LHFSLQAASPETFGYTLVYGGFLRPFEQILEEQLQKSPLVFSPNSMLIILYNVLIQHTVFKDLADMLGKTATRLMVVQEITNIFKRNVS
jgi:hypothetical protein